VTPDQQRIPLVKPLIGPGEIRAVVEVLRSGQLAQGRCVEQFEGEFAAMCGVRCAVAVNSGTAALHLALLAHGLGPGDEVITSPFTFAATANAVLMTGARPVFVDIRRNDFNIDPDAILSRMTPRTRALLPVHLYGHPSDMAAIGEIADRHGLAIIEDACQAHGAKWAGRMVGSFGTGCFSFYPTKNMTTGEGGMITTNDPAIAERLQLLRSHGAPRPYHHVDLGYNFRMTDLSAALGLAQLKRLDNFTRRRRSNARYYDRHLRGVIVPTQAPDAFHVYHQYTVRVPDGRDELQARLTGEGIGSAVYYPVPLHLQPFYRELGYADELPKAEAASREVLSLPVWPGLKRAERERVAEAVSRFAAVPV
jgi:perosamine synthetase